MPDWLARRWPLLVLLGATLALGVPMFLNPDGVRSDDAYRMADWLSLRIFDAYLYDSVHRLGEFPLWCPLLGGGYPVFLHPSNASVTPFAIPVLLLGEIAGVKLNLLVLLFLGGLGVFLIARDLLGLERWGALFSALSFLLAGWFPSMMLVGFYNVAAFYLIPLVLYFLVRAFDDLRLVIPSGLLFGLLAYLGLSGVIGLALFCGLLALGYCFRRRDSGPRFNPRPLLALALVGTIAIGAGAARIAWTCELTARGYYQHGKEGAPQDYDDLDTADRFYAGPGSLLFASVWHVETDTAELGEEQRDAEYAYLGVPWAALLLFLAALVLTGRRLLPWLIPGLLYLILCLGPNSPVDLYRILIWPIGPLREIGQFYKYFNFFFLLVIVIPAGTVISKLDEWIVKPKLRLFPRSLALASLIPFGAIHGSLFADLFDLDLPPLEREERFQQVQTRVPMAEGETLWGADDHREDARPNNAIGYYNLKRNRGTIDWYADIYWIEAAVPAVYLDAQGTAMANPEYRGEAHFAEGQRNVIEQVTIEGNRILVTAVVVVPGLLVINQNWDPDWQTSHGAIVRYDGLLAVRLQDTGTHEIELRYRPSGFWGPLLLSLGTLLACTGAWFVIGRVREGGMKRLRRIAVVVLVLLAAAALWYWVVPWPVTWVDAYWTFMIENGWVEPSEDQYPWTVAVDWSADGQTLVSSGYHHDVLLWNANSGKLEQRLKGHATWVQEAIVSPDGAQIATADWDGQAILWSMATGEITHRMQTTGDLFTVAFHPQRPLLAAGSHDGRLTIFDRTTGRDVQGLTANAGGTLHAKYSPDGTRLASAGEDGKILLFDAAAMHTRLGALTGPKTGITALSFTRDGAQLLSCGDDGQARLWDVEAAKVLGTWSVDGDWVNFCALLPDEKRFVTGGTDGTVRLYSLDTEGPGQVLYEHDDWVQCVRPSRDGTRLASGGKEGQIKVFDLGSGKVTLTIDVGDQL